MLSPPPFLLRLYQPGDFNAVLTVVQAAEQADGLPLRTTVEDLRTRLRTPHGNPRLDPTDDCWVAAARRSGVVAYADGWLVGEGTERSYRTACYVHPSHRGRGLGRALLVRQCQRAQAIARRLSAGGPPVTITLGARALEQQTGALAVLAAVGVPRVRTHLQMRRDLAEPLPAAPLAPDLRLETWMDPRFDEALWRAYDEGFSGHWGYLSEPFQDFLRRMALGHVQREHSLVAWAGDQVAGASLNDIHQAEPPGTEEAKIHHLFVRRAWRGRGLGRALVVASLAYAKQLGFSAAGLFVDEENQTGAVHLYESCGFRLVTKRYVFQMTFAAAADEGQANQDKAWWAIAWLLWQPQVSSVIAGATRPEQVEANARAADWELTADELKQIRKLLEEG